MQFIVGLGMHSIETVLITVEAPQLPSRLGFVQFWTGCRLGLLLACSHSANCAEDRRDPTGAVLGHGCDACCCTTIGAWVTTYSTLWNFRSSSPDKHWSLVVVKMTMSSWSYFGKDAPRSVLDRALWGEY